MVETTLTPEDRERIRNYLEKPAYSRDYRDLIPDEESGEDPDE
jgi:hypothetical protein